MSNKLTIAQPRVRMEEPHNCTDAKDVLSLLTAFFDPLVAYGPDLGYVPGLAARWRVSDDARTWTFTLRPGATFHNGDAVDAEAVKYNLERMARPEMGVTLGAPGVYHQYLADMQLDIVDRRTIRLKLTQPVADLLDILVTGYILPPADVERLGEGFKTAPMGTGPFQFVDMEDGVRVRAVRNPHYFQPMPDYASVEWVQAPNPDDRLHMVRKDRATIAPGPPFATTGDGEGVPFLRSRGSTVYILIFNASHGPMADPRMRLALNLGVDREALIQSVLNGAGYPLNGFVSPVHFGFDPGSPPLAYAPDRAIELIREAGHGSGLRLTLDSPTALPDEAVRLSEVLADQLALIGVDLSIVYTEDRELYANKVRRKEIHDMCVFDSSPLSTFRVLKEKVDARFAGSWWQGYHNADVEKLLDEAQSTPERKRRETLYRRCFHLLNDDPPWLYLYNHMHITWVSPRLSAWKLPAHGVVDPRHVP